METKFNFNSSVCTSKEQSERLLALGLKKETADCGLVYKTHDVSGEEIEAEFLGITTDLWESDERTTVLFSKQKQIPAWSLHRLLFLYNCHDLEFMGEKEIASAYDVVIEAIESAITGGYFNEKYLE